MAVLKSVDSRVGPRRRVLPVGLMAGSVLAYSLVPLLLAALEGESVPFLFSAVYRAGGTVGGLLALWRCRRCLDGAACRVVWRRLRCWKMLLVLVPYFSYTAFAWSARFVDVTASTIILELWPVLFIVLTARFLRQERRFVPVGRGQVFLVLAGFAGFVFVALGQGGVGAVWGSRSLLGVALGLASAVLAGATAYNYRWALELSRELLCVQRDESCDLDRLFFVGLLLAFTVGSFVSCFLNLAAGLAGEIESVGRPDLVGAGLLAFAGGLLLDAGGTVFNRVANLMTDDLGINALGYFTPVLALGWLFACPGELVGVARVDYLVIGAAAIMTSNLLINLGAEVGWRSRILLLFLLAVGAGVYLGG